MADSRIGQSVRTPEGHAAMSMTRSGPDDLRWVEIQNNTFLNWVNEQINIQSVTNFEHDFNDGVALIELVEALQHKPIGRKVFKNPVNQHQRLENVSIALDSIRNDNVKLVNIGSEDIVGGNLKLILGLIWHLILRYQIGKTKFPPKKMMLAWLQSAIPKCEISNFSSSWNDGVALHALIEYCSPGTCPNWEKLDRSRKLDNCRNAMNIAKEKFDIPLVVRPEDMASHHLDELSGMTYLSYYMKQDSPGYYATLTRVCKLLQRNINNFTTDWNDGQLVCELVRSVGGNITNTGGTNEEVLKKGLSSGKELGYKPLMSAKEIAAEKEEHLGIMAYAAQFLDKGKAVVPQTERVTMNAQLKNVHVGNETPIHMNILDKDVSQENIQIDVSGPNSKPPVHVRWTGKSGIVSFIPVETGQHKLTVLCDGQVINGCPKTFNVNADRSKVSYLQIENCCVGTITEVKVNAVSAGHGTVRVEAKSPSGHVNNLPITAVNGIYNANFTPAEVGNWQMSVYYDGEHISGSPFDVNVFDPAQVNIYGIDGGTVGKELNFKVDSCHAGKGDLQVRIKYEGRDVPLHLIQETNGIFKVNFTPQGAGLYEIQGLFNGVEIKGSPYTLEIIDSNMVSVSGSGLEQVAVNKLASFDVNTKGAGGGDVKIEIKSPSNESLPFVMTNNDGVYNIQFTPKLSGDYVITIKYNDQIVAKSPYICKVFDVSKVSVSNMPKSYESEKSVHFDIDASQAGSGNLEIQVNGGRVPCYVKNLGNHKFSSSFMPVNQEPQVVEMTFNELHVKGSPWYIEMVDNTKLTISDGGTKYIPVNTPAKCTILGPVSALENLKAKVTAPGNKIIDHKSNVQSDGKLQVEFLPEIVGTHKVDISYAGNPLKQSPTTFKVYDAHGIILSQIPQIGMIGRKEEFTIDTSKCGDGSLKIVINNGKLKNKVEKISKDTYGISFVPVQGGPHQIGVTFNDIHVHDSPYTCMVQKTEEIEISQMKNDVPCDSPTDFTVKSSDPKELNVVVVSPDGQKLPLKVKSRNDKTYLVEWVPSSVGEHEISVIYAGVPVKGSPFNAKAYDTNQVIISSLSQGILGKPVNFFLDASKAGAGNLEIFISVNGENVPNYVKQEPRDACFKVSFVPQQPYKHLIHIKFNGVSVPGSPFPCNVVDNERIHVSGDALQLACANTLSSFKIDSQGSGNGDLTVNIVSSNGKSVPARINGSSSSTYRVDFSPTEVGKHQISIFYGDVEVKNSPFSCNVFDASLAKLKASKRIYLNKSSVIEVDTSMAGIGHLEAEVKCQGKLVHSTLREVGTGLYDVTFAPRNTATHLVSLLFNDYPMPGSPLHMEVIDSSTISASGEGLWSASVYRESTFNIDTHGDEDNLSVKILSPSGRELPFNNVKRGKLCHISFTPREVGKYTIEVLLAEQHITNSPFHCNVFDPNSVQIIDVDREGKIDNEITFAVDASAGGNGEVEASVKHYGQTISTNKMHLGNNHYRFMFLPEESGKYEIDIRFNNEKIPGCPVVVQIQDEIPMFISINFQGIKQINAMDLNWFIIELDGKKIDINELQISIRAPNRDLIPIRMIPQHDGDYKVEWTPTIPGRYSIDVLYGSHQIQGSPFMVDVFDVSKIHVDALSSSIVGEQAKFVVDYSSAGKADYAVKIVSPSGQIIPFDVHKNNNKDEISYIPTEGGKHKIYVTYGGIDIPGTPIIQEIGEGGMPTAHGDGLYKGEEDKPATFYVDSSRLKGDLFVQVDSPNSIAKCNIDPEANGTYTVTYVPVEVGLYGVQVKWNNKEIQGSPFHPKIVNARKVRVVGGWQHFMDSNDHVYLVVDEVKKIPFDISEAGPGKLTAEVRDPNNDWLPVHIDTSSDGKNILAFVPKVEGNHLINVYWTEHPIVGAPFLGHAVAKTPIPIHDNSQVTLSGRGLKEAVIRDEAEFYIDGTKAGPGKPEVTLTGVRSEIDVYKRHLGDGRYHCTYTPVIPGSYLLNITWNNRQLKGSPYKVTVMAAAQPQKVNVTGEGLEGGILGKELQVNIDTRKAGPGELTAHCMGPTRVAYCDLTDNHDGIYKLTVRPQEPGRHILQIKFGGENVLGSPYVLKIGALPDASKVRVSGPGVEHGILATFQSHFLVETDGAGAGKLTVRIRGPKGAFQVHMSRESQRDRRIVCHYDPFETGKYLIHVKWSDVDVPGSPFLVWIVDTHEEYEGISQGSLLPQNGIIYSEPLSQKPLYGQWREDI